MALGVRLDHEGDNSALQNQPGESDSTCEHDVVQYIQIAALMAALPWPHPNAMGVVRPETILVQQRRLETAAGTTWVTQGGGS